MRSNSEFPLPKLGVNIVCAVSAVIEKDKEGGFRIRPSTLCYVIAVVLSCLWSGTSLDDFMSANQRERMSLIGKAKQERGMPADVAKFCQQSVVSSPDARPVKLPRVVRIPWHYVVK
jgi:hypothetical protein